ncbi:MAG: hypothetical protein NUV56_01370 [Candidatus Uhrbacteria bacterium]|nr:hypothetical protein [Candidatus Uhrbacteria bacterium]
MTIRNAFLGVSSAALLLTGAGCVPATVSTIAVTPDDWATYENPVLAMSIGAPSDADIVASVNTFDYEKDTLGRIGAMGTTENIAGHPNMSVSVYTSEEKIGRDFMISGTSSLTESMTVQGLDAKTATVDGTTANVYSGVHAVDGVGGSEYDYVAVELVGPTYAYILQFYGMGTDPNSEQIQNYLNSFDAK